MTDAKIGQTHIVLAVRFVYIGAYTKLGSIAKIDSNLYFIGQVSNRTGHGGKRRLMVPGGHVMAENDSSWRRTIRL